MKAAVALLIAVALLGCGQSGQDAKLDTASPMAGQAAPPPPAGKPRPGAPASIGGPPAASAAPAPAPSGG